MAREPELSIKVKVDPQIKPDKLKSAIEKKVKDSKEIPEIEIKPDEEKLLDNIKDALEDLEVPITPKIDTEKLKADLKTEIDKITDLPEVNIGVNVDDFSSELTKQLKDQLKEVNQQLSYYLKNLTSNTDRLGSFVNDIFPTKELKTSAKQVANEVSDEFTGGLSKAFNINNLLNFKNSDKVHKRTLSEAKNLASQASDLIKGFVATKDSKYWENGNLNLEKFNEDFLKLKSTASSLSPIIRSFMSALESNNDEIKSTLDIFNKNGFNLLPNSTDIAGIAKLLSIVEKFANISFNEDSVYDFTDALGEAAKKDGSTVKAICDGAVSNFTNVQRKVTEINSNIKQTRTEIKDVQKEANATQKTDTSGHLDASTIETYGQKLDNVLSNIADKQNAINDARKTAVDLEKNILAATVLTREGLSNELTQYEALFKKFDTDKIAKFAETTNLADFIKNQEFKMQAAQNSGEKDQIEDGVYNVKKVKFDIDPAVLQTNIDAIFENVSAPIRLSLAPGTIDNLINEITPKLDNIQININNSNSNNGVHFKNWPEAVDALLNNAIDDTMKDVGMGVLKALELDADHSKALKKLKETYGFDKIIKDTDAGITAYFLDDKTGYDDMVEEASKWYNNYIAQIQKSKPVDVKGKITITDADVVVDVKNPVAIPGTVTVDPTSVQLGNSDDLQKNASALSSVKQSLNKISTSAEDYGTKIATIGPSVQYVTQEVDNLSKSLENQITDLDLIAKKTDAYGTTANSIMLNTKDVAVAGEPVNVPVKATLKKAAITVPKDAIDIKVTGVLAPEAVKQAETVAPQKPTEIPGRVILSADDVVAPTAPVDIPGKVTLKVEDVKPPKGSVKIPGKVELKVSDITPPKTAVELEGKVSNVTVDDSAKGKKKNAKDDVKKPEVIDLKGKVELKDEDIKRPNPLNLNGAVKIKAADVKIDDVEISKKEFDIKGNLILKNTENIAKSTTGSESSASGISTVIDHPTVETDNFEARLAALDKLDHQSKEYKDGLEEIIADWKSTNKEIDEAIDSEKKLNSVQEDRQKALDQIRAAIKKNSNNMDRARKNGSAGSDLYSKFNAKQTMYKALEGAVSSGSGVKDWAKTYFPAKVDDINNVTDALREMRGELTEDQIKLAQVSADKSIERSANKAATAVANLKSQIHDYLETNKKIQNSELAQPFRELMNALNSENAPEKIGELQKQFAELRARSKELGLETESLIDKFEKLFGTHLSTMITMAALHKVREGMREIYQNVVQIDTAVTELRKVSEYASKSLEEYMGRAAEQAQKLGVSISDYINSTADWKRLGYSDEDAENMATYSTLLRNVGDGIDDVNTSSSYLISTLQGFGLLAKDAENVVDQIDKVANTQPITAQAIGEILTRSAASMKAANNDLAETISLGTAAYAVIQNAETVGTTLKSVSMYLRAAKSELEDAGESADGCANSVSELRSELKSLTGVDIMIDNKSFKSTYQILKELSQVWDKLSDVTQANVTEMIGGKRNANAISAILNNFDVAESAMESAANSAGTAWEENSVWMDSIQGRLAQLDASFQVLSQDVLSSGLLKTGVSFLTSIVKLLDKIINLTGALPAGLGITAFATQLGEPKMTGFMIVPSNTPGGDTEQMLRRYFIISLRSMREYLVKPTNMVA